MVKSVIGSFIINCDVKSEYGREINKSTPTYDGEKVVVLQAECYPYGDTIRMLYELIRKE